VFWLIQTREKEDQMPKKLNDRDSEDLMAAEIIRVEAEVNRKYGVSPAFIRKLVKQHRLNIFGSPSHMRCSHYESQLEKNFPVLIDPA